MSLVHVQPGSLLVIPASEWARLLAQGPTDVQTAPGGRLIVFPDAWAPEQVAAVLMASGAPSGDPNGAPPP